MLNGKKFVKKLDFLAKEKGYNRTSLCKHLGICYDTVSMWNKNERINPKLDVIQGLANFFEISIDDLISEEMIFVKKEKECCQNKGNVNTSKKSFWSKCKENWKEKKQYMKERWETTGDLRYAPFYIDLIGLLSVVAVVMFIFEICKEV